MMKIIECESQFRHFNEDGTIVTNFNSNGSFDTGLLQINSVWEDEAFKRGININTVEGNIEMGKVILETKRGKKHWVCHK